jgi:zinc transporter ZupT
MPTWVKILTVLTTLPAWLAVIVVELAHGEIPTPTLMAIPAGVILATSGTDIITRVKRKLNEADADDNH